MPTVVLCHECDLPHAAVSLEPGRRAHCRRCSAKLYHAWRDDLDTPLALAVTGIVLVFLANALPFMTFALEGRTHTNNLASGVLEFWQSGFPGLAALVFLTSICLPVVSLTLMLYLLTGLRFGRVVPGGAKVLRAIFTLRPWAMMEVYLLGVIVAFVKLADLADVTLGPGCWSFIALILTVSAANATLQAGPLWARIDAISGTGPPGTDGAVSDEGHGHAGLAGCHGCGQVLPKALVHQPAGRCPRCTAKLHHRLPHSLQRTWAFLIAATVLFVPANLYPILTVISFGQGAPDTIISGVVHLAAAGQWPVAFLVFFASVFVPILKIGIIAFLLISVHTGMAWRARERTFAYRLTEFIGRWSMIDIFMISILIALVKLDAIATIEAGPGAVAFAAVVVLTMLAAMSFDPRLIWDKVDMHKNNRNTAEGSANG